VPIEFPSKEPTVVDIWRSPRVAYQDWQDRLQSRLDQEQTTIQALAEAVSAAEEATLPALRDSLIQASDAIGTNLIEQAESVTAQLLIDARSGGCRITTRVAEAIETLQLLLFRLRSGQFKQRKDWIRLQNAPVIRAGSAASSTPIRTISGEPEHVLAVVGEDNRIYSTPASRMFDEPWNILPDDWSVHQREMGIAFIGHSISGGTTPIMPNLAGPFDIPSRLSAQDLSIRKEQIRTVYINNVGINVDSAPLWSAPVEEAYYFVPVHLALGLQRSGEYLAALDVLRNVYDYTAGVSARKIYHGLVVEESRANGYVRGEEWLLDPSIPMPLLLHVRTPILGVLY
jgi:hypothetical protein